MSDDFAKTVTDDDISRALEDPGKIGVVAMVSRPGVRSLLIATEWRHFCPLDEALNAKFELIMKKWRGMLFTIMIVPVEYKERIDAVAEELHLKLVDGVPMVFDGEGASLFPIRCDGRMFYVENSKGAAVYKNNGNLFDQESDRLEAFEVEEKQKAAAKYQ